MGLEAARKRRLSSAAPGGRRARGGTVIHRALVQEETIRPEPPARTRAA